VVSLCPVGMSVGATAFEKLWLGSLELNPRAPFTSSGCASATRIEAPPPSERPDVAMHPEGDVSIRREAAGPALQIRKCVREPGGDHHGDEGPGSVEGYGP
jgi:hypothetical protein